MGILEATIDGDSARIRVPTTAAGQLTLRVTTGVQRIVATLDVAGFLGSHAVPGKLGLYLLAWPQGGRASVVGGDGKTIYQFVPGLGYLGRIVDGFSAGQDVPRMPGPTYREELLIVQPTGGGNSQVWQLLPQPHLVDTLPMPNARHLALLNDSTILRAFHHFVEVWRVGAAPRLIYTGQYEETNEIILSRAADRATMRVNGSATGPPVFNMSTGDTIYHVRELFRSYGAAFSEDGDTLWMVGVAPTGRDSTIPGNDYPARLVMLDARSGVVRRSRGFDHMFVEFVQKDPYASRLYLIARPYGRPDDAPPDLLILDSRTLADVGHASAPENLPCGSFCQFSILAVGNDGVFIVSAQTSFKFGSASQ